MNLQAEKLRLIEWLIQLQDVQIISRIVEIKRQAGSADYETKLTPMTVEELKARLAKSEEDIAAGRLHDLEELIQEYK